MALHALFHRLSRLPLAAGEDHPTGAFALRFGLKAIEHHFQRGGEGLAGLARKHADLEAALVRQPALLVGIEQRRTHTPYASRVMRRSSSIVSTPPLAWPSARLVKSSAACFLISCSRLTFSLAAFSRRITDSDKCLSMPMTAGMDLSVMSFSCSLRVKSKASVRSVSLMRWPSWPWGVAPILPIHISATARDCRSLSPT